MRAACLVLLVAVGWQPLLWGEQGPLQALTVAIEARDDDGFQAALGGLTFSDPASQGAEPGRYALEQALVSAPPNYLKACLDHGFDPNAVVEVGGVDDGWRSSFYRGTFAYNVLLSGRTELLAGLSLAAATVGLQNASLLFESGRLVRLRAETLAEASKRMGDADSLAFAAKLGSVNPAPDPSDDRLDALVVGHINDDKVRLRAGPGVTFASVGQLNRGTTVRLLEAGPTRFLNQEPWADHWFRVSTGDKIGWVWGRYLDLAFDHGGPLSGAFLVDFHLWKQKLYQDVLNRSRDERWRMRSLVEWAIQLQDQDFLAFLMKNKASDSVFLGEESESLAAKLIRENDLEGLESWINAGYTIAYDKQTSYGPPAFAGLLDQPQVGVYRLYLKGGYPFEAVRTSQAKNGGGDSWGSTTNTVSVLLASAPVSVLLDLIPRLSNVNQLFVSWEASYAGYFGVHVWSLFDKALQRGDARLVSALKKQGALARDQLLKGNVGVAIPQGTINDKGVRLRGGPGVNFPAVRILEQNEALTLLDEGAITSLDGETKGRWVYGRTGKGELGWVWGAYLLKKTEVD